jgi:hypothetical protein
MMERYIPPQVALPFMPTLAEHEHYAGLVQENGLWYHLILLPLELELGSWEIAVAWAAKLGGVLPTRREQATLYGNLLYQFKPNWYWSGDLYLDRGIKGAAWSQNFGEGVQTYYHKIKKLRARAVRKTSPFKIMSPSAEVLAL